MANIKFSQFTVGNTESDIDFVVGYKGGDNIQISPTNLLAASLSGYLPLVGGTMTGTSGIHMPDNFALKAGNSQDLEIFHNGTDSSIRNFEGNLIIRNADADKDVIFQADDGAGGIATYFYLDGSLTTVTPRTVFPDNSVLSFGTGADLQIYHSGTDSVIDNLTGDLYISNKADNKDIIFRSDDGGGGFTEYFRVDGGDEITLFSKNVKLSDSVELRFGNSNDLVIKHNATNSVIDNTTGDLILQNQANDEDIVFKCDNGSGAVIEYLRLDGSDERLTVNAPNGMLFFDNIQAKFGTSSDLKILHDGTDSVIQNNTGNLKIFQNANDKDITFYNDDGSGGTTAYFFLDGSKAGQGGGRVFTKFPDNSTLSFGADLGDLQIYHDGSDNYIDNITGHLIIQNQSANKDIIFKSDDGSGGLITYFQLDGSSEKIVFTKDLALIDNVNIGMGNSGDYAQFHDGTNTYLSNGTGDFYIRNQADDKDIIFQADDGSGGNETYFFLDGSAGGTNPITIFPDSSYLKFGSSQDLSIVHSGSGSEISHNGTGDLVIQNTTDDKDIVFNCDDGSGGVTTYFSLDGSIVRNKFSKNLHIPDNVKAEFGSNNDLEIYHDGSDSIIKDGGTGSLSILSSLVQLKSSGGTNNLAKFFSGGNSYIYANNVLRIEATSSGAKVHGDLNITNVSEYADNTAAIAAGLTTGDVYRTGDLLKIVH